MQTDSANIRISSYLILIPAVIAIISALIPWYSAHLLESVQSDPGADKITTLHAAQRAAWINPISVQALLVLAGANQGIGREAEARDDLLKATELQPLNYGTWEALGLYERDYWNQQELSHEHLQKALSLNPNEERLQEEVGLSRTGIDDAELEENLDVP